MSTIVALKKEPSKRPYIAARQDASKKYWHRGILADVSSKSVSFRHCVLRRALHDT